MENLPKPKLSDFARNHKIHGLVLDTSPKLHETFTCREIGIICNPWSQSKSGLVIPWCCLKHYAKILEVMEKLSNELGYHYEVDSGSCLGAVKIGHYIPWDIDGDIFTRTEDFHHYGQPDGAARIEMTRNGMKLAKINNPGRFGPGTRYTALHYGGVGIDMHGRMGNLTLPESGLPTRVEVSGVWVKTHANPGEYSRSRYGPGYLKHAQSWRYEKMKDMLDTWPSGKWRKCEEKNFHGCLENHPTDGNVDFYSKNFEGWKNS